jgi:hypothetical protein
VPRSHSRGNTPAEAAQLAEQLAGAVPLPLCAGDAVVFDPRVLHCGRKPLGAGRRCLFVVVGPATDRPWPTAAPELPALPRLPTLLSHPRLSGWAERPAFAEPHCLAALPPALWWAVEATNRRGSWRTGARGPGGRTPERRLRVVPARGEASWDDAMGAPKAAAASRSVTPAAEAVDIAVL